ncbi:MAG: hypothetical protein OXG37_12090 [Actinomycetia bacterium]|nr:hypothetical protein [Actinomycetes bacterium]
MARVCVGAPGLRGDIRSSALPPRPRHATSAGATTGRRRATVGLSAALIASGLLASSCGGDGASKLRFGENTPSDLRDLAAVAWFRFDEAFSAHRDCLPPVELVGAWGLDSRGAYEPDTRTVVLQIPGTAAELESALIHELAHHLELNCRAHIELRPAFLEAQGFPDGSAWEDGTAWETTPSEQWAEAAIEVVRGHRLYQRNVVITAEARSLVAAWGRGELDDPLPGATTGATTGETAR